MKVFEFQTEVWLTSKVVSYSKPLHVCWAACLDDGYSVCEMQIGIRSFPAQIQK